jgi:AcrR family transcriptional regulator
MVTNPRLGRTRPDERREHILAVAAEAFALEGYGTTSMSSIAARLGGSKATLYKYFTSKEELFEAVMQRRCAAIVAPFRDLADAEGDPVALLMAFGTLFLQQLCLPDAIETYRTVHGEAMRFPEIAEAFFTNGPEAIYSALIPALTRLDASGAIDCPEPRLAAGQFLGMVRGDLHMRVTCGLMPPPPLAEIERQVAHAARIFVNGIAPR